MLMFYSSFDISSLFVNHVVKRWGKWRMDVIGITIRSCRASQVGAHMHDPGPKSRSSPAEGWSVATFRIGTSCLKLSNRDWIILAMEPIRFAPNNWSLLVKEISLLPIISLVLRLCNTAPRSGDSRLHTGTISIFDQILEMEAEGVKTRGRS